MESEFEAGGASSVSQGFNTAVEEITVTVEHYLGDTGLEGLGSDSGAYGGCYLAFCAFLVQTFGRTRYEGAAGKVVDELHVNLLEILPRLRVLILLRLSIFEIMVAC